MFRVFLCCDPLGFLETFFSQKMLRKVFFRKQSKLYPESNSNRVKISFKRVHLLENFLSMRSWRFFGEKTRFIFLCVPEGFSKIFFAESYLQLKTLRLNAFVNPDSLSNIAQNAFLCLERFLVGILLDSRNFFSSYLISCGVAYDWDSLWIRILTLTQLKTFFYVYSTFSLVSCWILRIYFLLEDASKSPLSKTVKFVSRIIHQQC